jgi:Mg2+-importing ATPase
VVPEALPLVTTFSLARGARRLAKNNVIVKRLSAIEDLGAIEVLCSDKTGTLTQNKLSIIDYFTEDKEKTLLLANLASSLELKEKTEPFDIALEADLSKAQAGELISSTCLLEEPFDPKERRNVSVVNHGGQKIMITRGAPEEVLAVCSKLLKKDKTKILDWVKQEGRKGHRVLALASKELSADFVATSTLELFKEKAFTFSGIISFVDPIKDSSLATVESARQLGVRVVVITGDSPEVAGAVGHEISLIDEPEEVMTGTFWSELSTDEQMLALEKYSVFARVSPEQKFNIIKTFRQKYMVGFLGEGINDAPALKLAGVSLVVESASDIARESADIVLLQKNLAVILDGIREGREVFANSTKYIKSTLASNFGNFFAVASASLFVEFLPMLPIQILLLNLLSDTPMISISTDRVDPDELVSPKKYEVKDIIIIAIVLGVVSTIFDFIFFALFFQLGPSILQTNWFIGSTLTELALIFSLRTKSLFIKGTRPSASLTILSLITIVLTIGIPFTSIGQNVFRFTAPSQEHLTLIISLVGIYFVCSEIVKLFYYHNNGKLKNFK